MAESMTFKELFDNIERYIQDKDYRFVLKMFVISLQQYKFN